MWVIKYWMGMKSLRVGFMLGSREVFGKGNYSQIRLNGESGYTKGFKFCESLGFGGFLGFWKGSGL